MNFPQIIDLIINKSFSPIYLLYGDEPYFIKKICHALQKNVISEDAFKKDVISFQKKVSHS